MAGRVRPFHLQTSTQPMSQVARVQPGGRQLRRGDLLALLDGHQLGEEGVLPGRGYGRGRYPGQEAHRARMPVGGRQHLRLRIELVTVGASSAPEAVRDINHE